MDAEILREVRLLKIQVLELEKGIKEILARLPEKTPEKPPGPQNKKG